MRSSSGFWRPRRWWRRCSSSGSATRCTASLLLIVSFGALSGLYVLLGAPFVAAIQIIIYAGAIMVLFLFVVMLLNVPTEDPPTGLPRAAASAAPGRAAFGAVLSLALVVRAGLGAAAACRARPCRRVARRRPSDVRNDRPQALPRYAFAFEATSVLILVAMVGAIVLGEGRKRRDAA